MGVEIIRGKIAKPTKTVIYGPEGIGKSTLAAALPKPVFIDVEGGTSRLDVARTPRPTTWAHLRQTVNGFSTDQAGFETLVIDTADWSQELSIVQLCAELGIKTMGGNSDYGATYTRLGSMWSEFLTQLEVDFIDSLKMHICFVAHSTTKKHEIPEEEGAYDRYVMSLKNQPMAALKQWADLLLFCNYQTIVEVEKTGSGKTIKARAQGGVRRVIYTSHTAAWDAKNRDELAPMLDMEYASIAKCFCEIKPASKPATPPPVTTPQPTPPSDPNDQYTPEQRNLCKMILDAGVTWDQVNTIIAMKGYYPEHTPIESLDAKFINGFCCAHWDRIVSTIKDGR